jgi:hypothetical protein
MSGAASQRHRYRTDQAYRERKREAARASMAEQRRNRRVNADRKSLPCPVCGSETVIERSRHRAETVERDRWCAVCYHDIVTVERIATVIARRLPEPADELWDVPFGAAS